MHPRTCRPHSAVISVLLALVLALAGALLVPRNSSAATHLVTYGTFETGTPAGWAQITTTFTSRASWSANWDALKGNQFSNQVGSHVHSLP
jgi:hypothetical protein